MAYANWFSGMNYLAFSSMFDLKKIGVIGIGFTSMLYPDIIETISTGPRHI